MRDNQDLQQDEQIEQEQENKNKNSTEYGFSEMLERAQLPQGPKKKYGNMVVLYDGKILITLGPDYWCFIPTFIFFTVIAAVMISFVFGNSQNVFLKISAVVVCGGMPLSYLLVATSNPGIITSHESPFTVSQATTSMCESSSSSSSSTSALPKNTKQCKRCNLIVKRTTYHCAECDVCIQQYDHHCPWTSKCIGGGNLKRFYLFLCMIPVFIVYSFVTFGIVMSSIAMSEMAKNRKM